MTSPFNIVCPTTTLLEVEAWANAEFPRFFAPLHNMKSTQYVQLRHYGGFKKDNRVNLQPLSILAVSIGQTSAGTSVLARLAHNGDVEMFVENKNELVQGTTAQCLVVATALNDTKDIHFYMPFKCPIDANSPASLDRLESIIRWHYLVGGVAYAVEGCLEYFKVHFRDACRDIARAVGAAADDDDDGTDNPRPANTPPDLMADTDVPSLGDSRGETVAFNKLSRAMDNAYHEFKSSLFKQLSETQKVDQKRIAELGARCKQLEHIIASLDENEAKLTKELELTKAKLKTAEQSAVKKL